ncbi:hypothetical protein TCAL_14596 [Tigriopus californicus]|uniref:Uncharacterized protein n=1 Tax=Tigriopus californicus TaxID=6832 RepID=A0A553PD68_TIGCA|nr:hypothetical protein TCAL_14596 [Tigriopus californicus]
MKVNGMQLMGGGSVKDYLRVMTEAFGELSIIGSPMLEEDQIVQLLTSLPPSYKTLVTVLENQDTYDTWDAVTERLLSEEQRSKEDRQLLSPSADEKGLLAIGGAKKKINSIGYSAIALLCRPHFASQFLPLSC